MTKRTVSLLAGALLTIAGLALWGHERAAEAQSEAEVGRYQMATTATPGSGPHVYLLDTATGQIWVSVGNQANTVGWNTLRPPKLK
ncbi:hypothetical protein ACFL59_14395 [Planctomycetota bacterium]